MEIISFNWIITMFATVISAIITVIWKKADNAERISQQNKAAIEAFVHSVDKLSKVAERLSYLEASFSAEIKNLSMDVKRLEGAILRAQSK